jgi:hypothetical protein
MDGRFIYWVDSRQGPASASSSLAGGIYRIKPDGSGFQAIITSGIGSHSIRGLSVDWIAGQLVSVTSFLFLSCSNTMHNLHITFWC